MFPVALTAQQSVTSWPLSAETTASTCLTPVAAIIFLGFCTVVQPVSSTFQILFGINQGWDSNFLRTGSKELQTSDRIYIYDKIKQLRCYTIKSYTIKLLYDKIKLMKYHNKKTFYYAFLIHLCKVNALIVCI